MDIKALRYFLMVSETGSFMATARHFGVPTSSVSRFISALEEELKHQLLYRSTRAVRMTDEGVRFYSQVKEALEILDNAADQVQNKGDSISGKISINAPEALGRLHIANLVSAMQEKYPKVSVELTLTDAYIDPVQEGADITFRVSPLVDSGMIGRMICGQNYIVAASQRYLDQFGTPRQPEELQKHNCLLYRGISGQQKWYFRKNTSEAFESISVSGSIRSNNAEVLVSAAIAGRGIVLFPTWLFSTHQFGAGQLVRLFSHLDVSGSPQPTFIHALTPENKLRSQRIREILTYIIDEIGTPPYWDLDIQ